MKKDIEIAREAKIKDIEEIANYLEINDYEKYGKYKAKIKPCFDENKNSKLVLVT
ncbi:formate--tetrahydrofolate ligase, partial [Anaerococcus hydrogenalis]